MDISKIEESNYGIDKNGEVHNLKTLKILKPWITTTGYKAVKINIGKGVKGYKVHKLMELVYMKDEMKQCIDHIDRDRLNNKLDNLRCCTFSENLKNKSKKSNTSSIHTGVSKYRDKWESYIWDNYKKIRIGYFETEIEAHEKRKAYILLNDLKFYRY